MGVRGAGKYDRATLARPYAKAIVRLAKENNAFEQWSASLATFEQVFALQVIQNLVFNKLVDSQTLIVFILDIFKDYVSEQEKSLLRILAKNKRLDLLGFIREQYEKSKRKEQKMLQVNISFAAPLTENLKQMLLSKLEEKYEATLSVEYTQDDSLIGGVLIKAENDVIDASVKGLLNRLGDHLGG